MPPQYHYWKYSSMVHDAVYPKTSQSQPYDSCTNNEHDFAVFGGGSEFKVDSFMISSRQTVNRMDM